MSNQDSSGATRLSKPEFVLPPLKDQLPTGAALYIVAGPIGNLADITIRALQILSHVDLIFCEDTRKSALLLAHYGISTRRKSFRIHQLRSDMQYALSELRQGHQIAMLSDAGTPGISDPGFELVALLGQEMPEVPVLAIPGPAALSAALSVCGWAASPLHFYGFLPRKSSQRVRLLEMAQKLEGLLVFYESVHRIEKSLLELRDCLVGRDLVVFREMTKMHEERLLLAASLDDTAYRLKVQELRKKGEFTIIAGYKK